MGTQKSILIVTGTFSSMGGRPSFFGTEIYNAFMYYFINDSLEFINGGKISDLESYATNISKYKIIFWMPHIDGTDGNVAYGSSGIPINKFAQAIKKENKTAIFIQAKRNDHNEFSVFNIVEGMFQVHANLCLVISKDESYKFNIYDPLGNLWYSGTEIKEAAIKTAQFVARICLYTRVPSLQDTTLSGWFKDDFFIRAVQCLGWRFDTLINTELNKERFFGNASTRCMLGFPSIRNKDFIFISRRNINKQIIEKDDFVQVDLDSENVLHYDYGSKPSVDAPIQVKLYEYYRSVKYIIHGHTYVTGAVFTKQYIPCGCMEEVGAITELFPDHLSCNFAVNLIGHGCVMLANDLKYFAEVGLTARSFPENLTRIFL